MNTSKWTFAILLATACTLPAAAQTVKPDAVLAKKVEVTVQRSAVLSELTEQEKIAAEEELQHIRSVQDSNATFAKYPYLLDPAYRRGLQRNTPSQQPEQAQPDRAPAQVEKVKFPKLPVAKSNGRAQRFTSLRLAEIMAENQPQVTDTTSIARHHTQVKSTQHSPNGTWAKKVGI